MQDVDLGLGAVICVGWVLLVLMISWLLANKGYMKVGGLQLSSKAHVHLNHSVLNHINTVRQLEKYTINLQHLHH